MSNLALALRGASGHPNDFTLLKAIHDGEQHHSTCLYDTSLTMSVCTRAYQVSSLKVTGVVDSSHNTFVYDEYNPDVDSAVLL